jgi:ActR/RegA family two-component response regulator
VTGIEIARYPNISEAARVTGINRASIQHVLAGRYITAGGYKWNKG